MDNIEKATALRPPADVACHNDLLSENFIIDATGKMWIIDWEYGGMTDPYFDLGDYVMEHPFSREEERLIVATYCGQMDEGRFGRMMLYKSVSGVWWGVWAMIQNTVSQIDFDYMEWGKERIGPRAGASWTTPTTRRGSPTPERDELTTKEGRALRRPALLVVSVSTSGRG